MKISIPFNGILSRACLAVASALLIPAIAQSQITITNVSPILPQQTQTITISGTGFGTQDPYDGDSDYISFQDNTGDWEAGYSPDGNYVTLNVTSWTDNQIVISGFTGYWGYDNWTLEAGDNITIEVWNPQTDVGPASNSVTVGSLPSVPFTANPTNGVVPLTVQFASTNFDSSGIAITSWNWNFGDGSAGTGENPSHIYAVNGTFYPSLIATNNDGLAVMGVGPSITVSNPPVYSGLVLNGGFETGDFTGWSLGGNSGDNFVDDGSATVISPHSGKYFAAAGPAGALGYISQALTTVPGQSYLLSLWFNSPDGETPNEFSVSWNGRVLFDRMNLPVTGWTNLQFTVTASATNTVLQFGFRDDPSYLGLDDVSVVPPPTISTPVQTSSGQFQMAVNGVASQNYTIQMSTNLSSSNWVPVLITNSPSGSFLFNDSNATNQQGYYRVMVGP